MEFQVRSRSGEHASASRGTPLDACLVIVIFLVFIVNRSNTGVWLLASNFRDPPEIIHLYFLSPVLQFFILSKTVISDNPFLRSPVQQFSYTFTHLFYPPLLQYSLLTSISRHDDLQPSGWKFGKWPDADIPRRTFPS